MNESVTASLLYMWSDEEELRVVAFEPFFVFLSFSDSFSEFLNSHGFPGQGFHVKISSLYTFVFVVFGWFKSLYLSYMSQIR